MIDFIRKGLHLTQRYVPSGAGVHILGYHLIEAGTGSAIDIPLQIFEKQMSTLRSYATVCSLDEAVKQLESGKIDGTISVVTFDDAYENFYLQAWPVLQKYQIPATLYVPVNFVEERISSPISGINSLRACNWSQLREMADSGLVSIGSHSLNHPDLTSMSMEGATFEIGESRKLLEQKLYAEVSSFCYPRALWNEGLETVVRSNYRTAVIRGGRKMTPQDWNRYRLSRIPMRRNMPHDFRTVLTSRIWLEEMIAERFRSMLSRSKENPPY